MYKLQKWYKTDIVKGGKTKKIHFKVKQGCLQI